MTVEAHRAHESRKKLRGSSRLHEFHQDHRVYLANPTLDQRHLPNSEDSLDSHPACASPAFF